jgi:hypothetical protein
MKKSHGNKRLTDESKQKSLGRLYRAKQTKPRSPALTGQLHIQRHTLRTIVADLEESDGDEVVCNIAAWSNRGKRGERYVTVELSPKFKARAPKCDADIFDFFDDRDGN